MDAVTTKRTASTRKAMMGFVRALVCLVCSVTRTCAEIVVSESSLCYEAMRGSTNRRELDFSIIYLQECLALLGEGPDLCSDTNVHGARRASDLPEYAPFLARLDAGHRRS